MALLVLGAGVAVAAELKEFARNPPDNDRSGLPGTTQRSTMQSMIATMARVTAAAIRHQSLRLLCGAAAGAVGTAGGV